MSFLADLEAAVRASQPEWETARSEDGLTLQIDSAEDVNGRPGPRFHVCETEDQVLLDWSWKLPLTADKREQVKELILAYMAEAAENLGWEVPVILEGGPLHGRRFTKHREDLTGRLLVVVDARKDGGLLQAHLYKWRLKRNPAGEYRCGYESSLEGDEVDVFIARGVESTGPFVLIRASS